MRRLIYLSILWPAVALAQPLNIPDIDAVLASGNTTTRALNVGDVTTSGDLTVTDGQVVFNYDLPNLQSQYAAHTIMTYDNASDSQIPFAQIGVEFNEFQFNSAQDWNSNQQVFLQRNKLTIAGNEPYFSNVYALTQESDLSGLTGTAGGVQSFWGFRVTGGYFGSATATIGAWTGVYSSYYFNIPTGSTVTDAYNFFSGSSSTCSGTCNNQYGMYISELTQFTNNYELFFHGGGGAFFRDGDIAIYSNIDGELTASADGALNLDAPEVRLGDSKALVFDDAGNVTCVYDGSNVDCTDTTTSQWDFQQNENKIRTYSIGLYNNGAQRNILINAAGVSGSTVLAVLNATITYSGAGGVVANFQSAVNYQGTATSPDIYGALLGARHDPSQANNVIAETLGADYIVGLVNNTVTADGSDAYLLFFGARYQVYPVNGLGGSHTGGNFLAYGNYIPAFGALSGSPALDVRHGMWTAEKVSLAVDTPVCYDSPTLSEGDTCTYYDSGSTELRSEVDGTQVESATSALKEFDVPVVTNSSLSSSNSCGLNQAVLAYEENAALSTGTAGGLQFSIGNGTTGGHGIVQPCSGTVVAMSMTCAQALGTAGKVQVAVNGSAQGTGCQVSSPNSGNGRTSDTSCAVSFSADDAIAPITTTSDANASQCVPALFVVYD